MRDQEAIKAFLTSAFDCRENTIPAWNFDREGNLSFGVRDYTDFPGQKYDPEIGIFGMDITAVLERPGHRVSRRRRGKSKVGMKHRVSADESRAWFVENFNITSWRNEDGTRSRRENWTNHWMPPMRTQARHDSPPRAAIVPTMLPRRRTEIRFQENELRRERMQFDPLNDALVKITTPSKRKIQR